MCNRIPPLLWYLYKYSLFIHINKINISLLFFMDRMSVQAFYSGMQTFLNNYTGMY